MRVVMAGATGLMMPGAMRSYEGASLTDDTTAGCQLFVVNKCTQYWEHKGLSDGDRMFVLFCAPPITWVAGSGCQSRSGSIGFDQEHILVCRWF